MTKPRRFWSRLKRLALTDVRVIGTGGVDAASLDRLEELLISSDFGPAVTARLVDDVRRLGERGVVRSHPEFERALAAGVAAGLRAGRSDPSLARAAAAPSVYVVLGVNGAGKTTFIGKLAARLRAEGRSVLVAAGDTFRAGAIDQLRVWAERAGAEFVGATPGADPASVAWAAIDAAVARGVDAAIIDTAGRLHTSDALMDELRKVFRVSRTPYCSSSTRWYSIPQDAWPATRQFSITSCRPGWGSTTEMTGPPSQRTTQLRISHGEARLKMM